MPALLIAFASMMIQVAGTLVGRILIALGITYVSYKGFDLVIDWVQQNVFSSISSLEASAFAVVVRCRIPDALAIIFGAIMTKFLVKGLTSATFKTMVLK